MKATLEFNLPEEQDEFETAQRAYQYRMVLSDFDNYLRGIVKYTERKDTKTFQEVRDKLNEFVNDHNLSI